MNRVPRPQQLAAACRRIGPDRSGAAKAWLSFLLLVLMLLSLPGCERGADSGATANPVAPGRPGTDNEVVTVAPEPGSITESPQVGGNRGAVPDGVTGRGGTTDYPGRVQDRSYPYMRQQPGVGLDGGLETAQPAQRPASSRGPSR